VKSDETTTRLGRWDDESTFKLLIVGLLVLGVALRFGLYFLYAPAMWEDEAYWAWKSMRRSLEDMPIRPVGFMALTKLLVGWVGASARAFRFIPFVASLVSLLLMPYVAKRLFTSALVRLVVVALLATSPLAITMAAEFKHYGVEIAVFTVLLAAFLRYRERRDLRSLVLLLLLAWGTFFLSLLVLFLYPALFATIAWDAFEGRRFRRLVAIGATALLCLATITTVYLVSWHHVERSRTEKKWGTKYDAFYPGSRFEKNEQGRLSWTVGKYAALAGLPGQGRTRWTSEVLSPPALTALATADRVFWFTLHCMGLFWLIHRRRWRELAWLWTPLVVLSIFNFFGKWPHGAFRTNSGYLPYAILLSAHGIEALAVMPRRVARLLGPAACVAALLPAFWFRPGWREKGTSGRDARFDEALAVLNQTKASRQLMLTMDVASCRPWKYYVGDDAALAETIAPRLRKRFKPECLGTAQDLTARIEYYARKRFDFWLVLSDLDKFEPVEQAARKSCGRLERTSIRGLHLVLHCSPKPKPKP
jgi:hypothetical protein